MGLIEALFITRCGREGSNREVAGRVLANALSGATAKQIVAEFEKAAAEGGTVEAAYLEFLGRPAVAADVASWVKGRTIAGVRAGIAGSPEAVKRRASK